MRQIIVPLLLAVFLLSGCSVNGEPSTATIFAMDTVMELTVYGEEELITEATELIYDLEDRLSVTDAQSEIGALNRDGAGTVSGETLALIERALEISRLTDGALDMTVYPVLRAWGFTTGAYRVPENTELAGLLERVDYEQVRLTESLVALGEGQMIDLGAVAKGYTSGAVIDLWRESGVTSALLNLGGNVHALGAKPDGSPWRVGIQDPLGEGILGVLEIRDKAVITSGGYERYFERDGVTYWHILDPATGRPAHSGLVSVTVVGEDSTLCDGLSTALFVMGLEKAAALWRELGSFEAVLVRSDGSVYITEGLEGSFTLTGSYQGTETQVIRRG